MVSSLQFHIFVNIFSFYSLCLCPPAGDPMVMLLYCLSTSCCEEFVPATHCSILMLLPFMRSDMIQEPYGTELHPYTFLACPYLLSKFRFLARNLFLLLNMFLLGTCGVPRSSVQCYPAAANIPNKYWSNMRHCHPGITLIHWLLWNPPAYCM